MVIKINLLICFRAFCKQEQDKVLQFQVDEARKHFPDAKIMVAACGTKPVINNAEVFYYSFKPLGLTPPWDIATDYAKKNNFDNLIMVDGDNQFIFEEIKKLYDEHQGQVVIPERESRIIYIFDSKLDRTTLEDLENAYLRIDHNCNLKDPQPGLYLLNKDAIHKLNFKNIDSWAGDLAFLSQLYINNIEIKRSVVFFIFFKGVKTPTLS